ncbi:MAG: DUF3772 domain-containing protein [Rhodobacteraceae bacterium]|jgi:small-conductance mechanosensitive channel|nr:DUF3772 domain-containing protein [Paracoccaceae bacterium]
MRPLRALAVLLVALVAAAAPLPWPAGPAPGLAQEVPAGPDYAAWETFATRAENRIGDPGTTDLGLEQIRAVLVDWRDRFLEAQTANRSRIETVHGQIAALGPAPGEGQAEAPEIAERRRRLQEELALLQAPGIAAEEAYRRADGLVREIDRILRDRQADALMQLWPAPVNPANWPAGIAALSVTVRGIALEVANAWDNPVRRAGLAEGLPRTLFLLALAVVLILRGRRWMERLTDALARGVRGRGGPVWAFLVSLGQIVVPYGGILALVAAARSTGLVGLVGNAALEALPDAGLTLLFARWIAGRVFAAEGASIVGLAPDRLAEGRFHGAGLGLLLALEELRRRVVQPTEAVEAANAVLTFPLIALTGLLLFRIGQLLSAKPVDAEGLNYRARLIGLLGRAAMAVGVAGPLMGAIGYVAAAGAVVFPAVLSLALLSGLVILQRLAADLYAALLGTGEEEARGALVPVLFGFALAILAMPVLALIWGARDSDLWEIWSRFREGFQIGGTRIAPTDFVTFALVFAAGFMATRLLQGALSATVLPRTSLDSGGQKAVVAGLGYVGVTLAALVAFSTAGIDLSSLAIVAGALSVGIGFGLQNIVSNFVSGIILLVERPISEGDWIEVGGTSGWVRAISVRSTRIETFDRSFVIVPNSDLISGRVTNWTRFNLTGRLIVPVGVAYGTDTRKVERVLREIAEDHPLVVLNPRPMIVLMGFGDSALNFEMRVILRDVNFSLATRSELNHAIARRFAEEGIEIPFPQRDLWLRNAEALRASAATAAAPPHAGGPAAGLPAAAGRRDADGPHADPPAGPQEMS